jgi:hypothetical protein
MTPPVLFAPPLVLAGSCVVEPHPAASKHHKDKLSSR